MPKHDYYKTLDVERGASGDDIRKSYRRLARKYHPDLNPGDKAAEERFKNIQEAYDVLSDSKKRQMYDQVGFYSENAFPGAGAAGGADPHMGFSGFDFSEFFSAGPRTRTSGAREAPPGATGAAAGAGGFRDLFSNFFRGADSNSSSAPQAGSDLEYGLTIDFWKAIRGTQEKLNITRNEVCSVCQGNGSASGGSATCPQCGGSGSVSQMAGAMRFNLTCPRCSGTGKLSSACTACHGDGRVARSEVVEVRIPPGAQTGSRLRVPGKGNAGSMGMPPGDLYITMHVEPHPFFQRNGDDIEIRVPITVTEAGLGAKIEVPTIEGRALLKIPPGTQNAQKFRMREKGVFNTRKDRHGDQIVEVAIQAPKVQDERTKEILRELAKLHPDDPRASLWTQV